MPAAKRFLSIEPMLGPIDISFAMPWRMNGPLLNTRIDWVICGGESGPHARPMHPDWVRSLRDQCQAASVPFFFKQWGEWTPAGDWYGDHPVSLPVRGLGPNGWTDDELVCADDDEYVVRIGKKSAGRLLDGREWNEVPT